MQWLQDTKGVIKTRLLKDRQYNGYKIPKGYSKPSTEEQTIQWPQDTKEVITSRLLKDRHYNSYKIP
jgi:hypothetical protein